MNSYVSWIHYELGCTKVSDALIQQKAWLDYLSRGTVTVWLTSNLMIVVGTQATNTQIWLGCQSLWSSFQKEIHATLARNRNRDSDTEYLLLSAGARAATAYRKLSWLCRGQCRNGSGAVLIELSCQSLSGISAVRSTTRAAARDLPGDPRSNPCALACSAGSLARDYPIDVPAATSPGLRSPMLNFATSTRANGQNEDAACDSLFSPYSFDRAFTTRGLSHWQQLS